MRWIMACMAALAAVTGGYVAFWVISEGAVFLGTVLALMSVLMGAMAVAVARDQL